MALESCHQEDVVFGFLCPVGVPSPTGPGWIGPIMSVWVLKFPVGR